MPFQYPVETVYRALALYLDFLSFADIEKHEGMPHHDTLSDWAKNGMGTEGYSWEKIRNIVSSARAVASYQRAIGERAKLPWEERQKEMTQDLLDARDFVMQAIRGGTVKQPQIGDLEKIIKAEALVAGEATQRIETTSRYTKLLGQIIKRRIMEAVKERKLDRDMANRMLDLVAMDFAAVLATGGDEKAMKQITP